MNSTAVADRVPLSRRPELGALAALFVLTLRQQVRGRRLLALSLLFCLPSVLAVMIRLGSRIPLPAENIEFALLLNLVPCALAPLASLLYASGLVRDDVEEQTLTYLLLRPLPRWALYLTRLLATMLLTALLTAAFTAATFVVIALTTDEPLRATLALRAVKTCTLLALAEVGYCALFGLLGLLLRRSLLVGLVYIILFEGLLASLDTLVRRMTVMYYFRVLVQRWLHPVSGREWSLDVATAPSSQTCVWILLGASAALAAVAAAVFALREFRMKTPEGS
jgi:ABC-2 type transport system permease protein